MKGRLRGAVYAAVLVWINAYICRDWLYHPTAPMQSLYGYWAALAKWGSWGWQAAWWPYWDFGSPMEFTSAPLVPMLAAAIAAMRGVSHLMAVQTVSAMVYCAAPVAVFAAAWGLTRAPGASFVAALAYSLLAPAQIVAPDNTFAWARILEPHRFMLQAVWDETPRALALVFLLLFVMLFARWTEDRRPRQFAGASIALAIAMLASPFAAISAALALVAVRRASAAGAGALLLALALAARWLPPPVWSALGAASAAHDGWNWHTPKHVAAAGIGWAVLVTVCERWIPDWRARWAVLWAFLLLCAPVFNRWLHATLLPQPHRYRIEMEAALALAAAFGLRAAGARMRKPVQAAALAAAVALAAPQVIHHRRLAKDALYPSKAEDTAERRIAERAAREFPGVPVVLPGAIAHWANWFAPVTQFAGSEGTTAYNQIQQRALVDIYAAHDVSIAVSTLEAFGAAAVVAPPGRFDGVLPAVWSEGGLTAYRAPGRQTEVEWTGKNRARVKVEGGAIPISYHSGWRATVEGRPVELRRSPLGLISVAPDRAAVELTYDGGWELGIWRWVTAAAALGAGIVLARGRLGR